MVMYCSCGMSYFVALYKTMRASFTGSGDVLNPYILTAVKTPQMYQISNLLDSDILSPEMTFCVMMKLKESSGGHQNQ